MVVIFLNICASFDAYLVNTSIKYMKGDVYLNNTLAGIGEVVAYYFSVVIFERLGFKKTFFLSFAIGAIGGLIYLNFAEYITDYVFLIIFIQ